MNGKTLRKEQKQKNKDKEEVNEARKQVDIL